MPCDRVSQRARVDAGSRVDDHAGGFVDDGQVLVFEYDVERDVFGFESFGGSFGEIDVDLVTFAELVRGLRGFCVEEDRFVLDQPLQPGARPTFDLSSEKCVEASAGIVSGCGNG